MYDKVFRSAGKTVRLEVKDSIILAILHQLKSFLDKIYSYFLKVKDVVLSYFAINLSNHPIKLSTMIMSAIEF